MKRERGWSHNQELGKCWGRCHKQEDVIDEANVEYWLYEKLDEISIDIMISIYCTRDKNVASAVFKDALCAEGIPVFAKYVYVVFLRSFERPYVTRKNGVFANYVNVVVSGYAGTFFS